MDEKNALDGIIAWGAAILAASAGVAARLGHTYAKRVDKAEQGGKPATLGRGEIFAAIATAPLMGIAARAFMRWWGITDDVIVTGAAGMAGLAGPIILLGFWERVIEPWLDTWRPPKRGG